MAVDLSRTAPPAPTTDDPSTTPPVPDQQGGPPPDDSSSDTPAWQRAASREEALAALLADETLPSEALTQHPRVAGIIGTQSKIQTQREMQRQRDQEQRDRRIQAAREGRYSELGEEVAREYVPDPQAEVANALIADARRGLAPMLEGLPQELRADLEGRTYEGSFGDGLQQWVAGLVEARLKTELPAAIGKAVKAREADLRKSIRAELSGEEESPEVTTGSASSGRTWRSVAEVEQAFLDGEATASDVRTARQRLPYRA